MTVLSKAELITAQAVAYPTKINNQRGLEAALILDIFDSVLEDQTIKLTGADPYTVIITTDSGKSFISAVDGFVFTLPAIAIGNTFRFENGADDGDGAIVISPDASDGITFIAALTDDGDVTNTKSTALKGDYMRLASLLDTVSWQVTAIRGIWARV